MPGTAGLTSARKKPLTASAGARGASGAGVVEIAGEGEYRAVLRAADDPLRRRVADGGERGSAGRCQRDRLDQQAGGGILVDEHRGRGGGKCSGAVADAVDEQVAGGDGG